jgi:hypothetical protein
MNTTALLALTTLGDVTKIEMILEAKASSDGVIGAHNHQSNRTNRTCIVIAQNC